jgi:hypothetical protein
MSWTRSELEWLAGGRVNCVLDALGFYRRRICTNGKQEKHRRFPGKYTLHSKRSAVSCSVFVLPHDHPTKQEQRYNRAFPSRGRHVRPCPYTSAQSLTPSHLLLLSTYYEFSWSHPRNWRENVSPCLEFQSTHLFIHPLLNVCAVEVWSVRY